MVTIPVEDPMRASISTSDNEIIQVLRNRPNLTVSQLEEELGVTANAVRQRLVRLMASGLICRDKSIEGRGRPCHTYHLSDEGHRCCGDNFPDLAKALWEEIQSLGDSTIRQKVMQGAAGRLAESYCMELEGETVEARLESVKRFFADRDIPISVETQGPLPVVKVLACPYPDLQDDDHYFCNVERQLFTKVLGAPVQLSCCQPQGDEDLIATNDQEAN